VIATLRVARAAAELQFREVAVSGFLLFGALVQPFFKSRLVIAGL